MEKEVKHDAVRQSVRANYAEVARFGNTGGCGCSPADSAASSCCGTNDDAAAEHARMASLAMGYSAADLEGLPEGANMGLGCGNPQAIASIRPGEMVLDLGSGGGFDAFLAMRQTGPSGRVIGVDMTPEMISKARKNAVTLNAANVEFRLGELEHLPVSDNTADVIISNCVINLSPDKAQVFREAFRALKPGGRLAVSDVVATAQLPDEVLNDLKMLSGCIAGAASIDDIERMLGETGFEDVRVTAKEESRELIRAWAPGRRVEEYVVSANIQAVKPKKRA
ncbi:MAG: arsenite methyltransferase [Nitrospinae bacterium]|nr:arsenite methyltransferase [Nitrospinota bacterium]